MVRRCACHFVMYFSQILVILFFSKNFMSLPGVATNQSRGKAPDSYELRLSTSKSKSLEAMLNKVTIRNVIRLAWGTLPCWSPRVNGHGVQWLKSCIQGFNRDITATALRKEGTQEALGPVFNRLKNRNNLRTTGFNPFGVGRSARSTLRIREGVQASGFSVSFRRSLNTKASVIALRQKIQKNKNKTDGYRDLIKTISSTSLLKLASSIVKGNNTTQDKTSVKLTSNSISSKILRKFSKDLLSGEFDVKTVK